MASLASCWLLVESFIIPDGMSKWFYLSFYVHPFFLIFCQIFLWLRWPVYIIFFLPFKITCYTYSLVLIYSRRFVIIIASYARFRDAEVVFDVPEYENIPELIIKNDHNLILDSYRTVTATGAEFTHSDDIVVCKVSALCVDEVDGDECSEEMENVDINEENSSSDEEDRLSSRISISLPIDDQEMNLDFPLTSVCHLYSPLREQELTIKREDDREEEINVFYKKYKEKMRWFDLLNRDRSFALSKILSEELAIISTDESREKADIQWAKMAKRRMVKSLENDLEMVYVSQTCLTWEALYYQYQKVESQMACSSPTSTPSSDGCTTISDCSFNYNCTIAGEFQKFRILLERFMEDEILYDGHRYLNYVQKRSSHESLLRVPKISAVGAHGWISNLSMQKELHSFDMEEEKEGRVREAMGATKMLKAIEKCIKTFLSFLQTEKRTKKQWWKANNLVWTRPPLEDPRDLKLLHDLTTTVQRKKLWLKDLKGKKRCWLKRAVNPLEESQKKEMLFAMIEMKLVSRVLSMSMISTRQLSWCQDKLDNIEFKEGKVIRSRNISPLFPSS